MTDVPADPSPSGERIAALREARAKIGGVVTVLDVRDHGGEQANAVDLVWSAVPWLLEQVEAADELRAALQAAEQRAQELEAANKTLKYWQACAVEDKEHWIAKSDEHEREAEAAEARAAAHEAALRTLKDEISTAWQADDEGRRLLHLGNAYNVAAAILARPEGKQDG